MDITVISSGSKTGNASIIRHGHNALLIDAGIKIRDIGKALNHKITDLDGVLISHEHMDHSKAVRELMKMGIDCYMSKGTAKVLNCKGHRLHIIASKKQFGIGGSWIILPIDLVHDASEPLGFIIAISNYKLLYVCDTAYIPYTFSGITHIMVECNYSIEILREKITSGSVSIFLKRRLMQSHMNIDTVKRFLQANDLSQVQEIWLLHLSDKNSDEKQFKTEIQKLTGKMVKVA